MRWYTLQTYWVGIVLFLIWLAVILKILVIDRVRHNIRKRYMLSCGYEYQMRADRGYANYEWWEYVKNGVQINEEQIDRLGMRQVRKRYQ